MSSADPQEEVKQPEIFVSLPLDAKNRSVIKHLSSSEYLVLVNNTFIPIDLSVTVFRYDRMCEHDATLDAALEGDGIHHAPDKAGVTIDFTSQHTPYAILIVLAIAGFAAINYLRTYKRIQRDQQDQSHHYVFKKLYKSAMADSDSKDEKREEKFLSSLQDNVQQAFQECPELQEKYTGVTVNPDKTIRFVFKRRTPIIQQPPKSRKEKIEEGISKYVIGGTVGLIGLLWNTIGIMSFSYWLFWMASALFTRQFGEGIVGLGISAEVGFVFPAVFGALYVGLRILDAYRQHKIKKTDPSRTDQHSSVTLEQRASVKKDALLLLRTAMRVKRKQEVIERARKDVGPAFVDPESELKQSTVHSAILNNTLRSLGQDALPKGITAFFSNMNGTFIGLQYSSWVVKDILKVVFNVAVGLPGIHQIAGWAIIGISGMYGIVKGIMKGSEVRAKRELLVQELKNIEKSVETLETQYTQSLEKFNDLENKTLNRGLSIPIYFPTFKPVTDKRFFASTVRPAPNNWTKVKKVAVRVLDFLNNCMSGIFILRVLIVPGTASYLPFNALALSIVKGLVGATALTSTTFTGIILPIIFVGGVLFAGFKLYEYNRARKEKRIQALYDQRKEKLAHLKDQLKMVKACTQVLQKKNGELPALVENKVVPPPVGLPYYTPTFAPQFAPSSLSLTPGIQMETISSSYSLTA